MGEGAVLATCELLSRGFTGSIGKLHHDHNHSLMIAL